MNRRQLIASLVSAVLVRTSAELGVAKPVADPKAFRGFYHVIDHNPPRFTIDEILLREAHRINHGITKRILDPNPFLDGQPPTPPTSHA
jgi:hypothetical protein